MKRQGGTEILQETLMGRVRLETLIKTDGPTRKYKTVREETRLNYNTPIL